MDAVVIEQQREEALASLKEQWTSLSKIERGEGIKRLVKTGFTGRQLGKEVGCSEALIRQLIDLTELPPAVREEYEAGEIGRKKALQLAKE